MESEATSNSKYLYELAALEINAIWRMYYYFLCLNTTICEFNDLNIGAVHTI